MRTARTVDCWFMIDVVFERKSRLEPSQKVRTLMSRSAYQQWAAETTQLQFRVGGINVFNHLLFNPPNTASSSRAFVQVTETWPP